MRRSRRDLARVLLGLSACASVALPRVARAEPPEEEAPPAPDAATIPVRIEAGSDIVSIDDLRCRRGSCEGRIAPGRHTVKREVIKDGALVTDHEEDVEIGGPSIVRVDGPGLLRRTASVTVVAGATIVLAGLIVPLVLCKSSDTTDPVTGVMRHDAPCDSVSDGVKVAWIGGLGIGLTLLTLGLIGYATTSGESHVSTRRWALLPLLAPTRREGQLAPTFGLGVVTTF